MTQAETLSNQHVCPCCGAAVAGLDLLMDQRTGIVSYNDQQTRLTPQEFRLLKALIDAYPAVLTKEECLEAAAADERNMPGIKLVDVRILHLRKKMEGFGLVITTAWGVGYRLELEGDLKAEVLRTQRFAEGRNVRHAIDGSDITTVRMLRAQGYPLTDIARRLHLTFKAVSAAMDAIAIEDDRLRDRTRKTAEARV